MLFISYLLLCVREEDFCFQNKTSRGTEIAFFPYISMGFLRAALRKRLTRSLSTKRAIKLQGKDHTVFSKQLFNKLQVITTHLNN